MARGRPLSKDIREAIINASRNGTSTYRIAKDLRVSRSTVQNILNLYKRTGNIIAQKKTGRPCRRGEQVDFHVLKNVINPKLNGVHSNIVTAPSILNTQQGIKNKSAAEIGKPYFVNTCNNGSIRKIKQEGNNNYRKYFPNYYDRTKKFDPQEPEVNILFDNGDPNYNTENGDSMQQMDYFQEESQQYPEITSNQQHHNQQCNMSESAQSSQKPKKFKIKKKKGNTTLAATLESLQTVTKAISSTHDEFNLFGEYMAMSLRTMPLRNALRCKEKLLSIIVNERLNMNTGSD